MRLLLCAVLAAPAAASAQDQAALATVNGEPILRAEAMDRAWRRYGTQVVNEMADEILVRQAARALKVAPAGKEADARLKRIRDQFPDEATFAARLASIGLGPAELRAQLEAQVLREALVTKAKGLEVSEKELRDFFEANKERLAAPPALRARHLLLGGEKEANDFLVAVRAGADFAKLASQVSLDAGTRDKGGDMGFLSPGMLQPEIEKVVFALKPGEVSAPVRTSLGFHLFKAEELRPAKAPVYKEIKEELRRALLADKISKAWPAYLQELRDKAKYETPRPR